MLKSIIRTALRNMLRHGRFTAINLVGLSVSMSLGLLIILVVREQFTYDNFHQEADRIYRVNTRALRVDGGSEPYASVPMPIAGALQDQYTFAEHVVRINRELNGDAEFGNVNVPLNGLFVDASFLQVFNFPLAQGDAAKALTDAKSMVLTHHAATKIFGDQVPLGQTITINGYGDFTITGVLKPFPSKTHFEFEALASFDALPALERQGRLSPSLENWNNYYSGYVYVKLKKGRLPSEVEAALKNISKTNYANLALETRDRGYEFYLQALSDITPGPPMSNQMGTGMPDLLLVFMGVLVAVVMLMACFNYTNLTIAKSLARAREIGVRKVIGAQRSQVFVQFVGEAIVFAVAALGISYGLLQLLKPAFMQLNIAREFAAELKEDMTIYLLFFGFAVLIGLLAGLLPASYLSALKPVKVLKDSSNLKLYARLTFRKALIVAQFSLSLIFVLVVLTIYQQISFMLNKNYGVNDQGILNVRLQGVAYAQFAQEVAKIPGVERVGGVSHQLGTWADRSSDYKRDRNDEPFVMRDFIVDANYVQNLDLEFLAGRNFDETSLGDREREVILNEKALARFEFTDPVSAIGQTIFTNDSLALSVVGVVKDFHFRPLSYEIGPLALRNNLGDIGILSAKINTHDLERIESEVGTLWKKFDPIHALDMIWMSDAIDQAYEDAGFNDVLKMVGYVSFLALTLACLGMLGMAMYATRTRLKEIGIRKVMGANTMQVTILLSQSFLSLMAMAVVAGLPIGYWLGGIFLENYAYRVDVSVGIVALSIGLVVTLGLMMVGSQTWKAASVNPVQTIRHE